MVLTYETGRKNINELLGVCWILLSVIVFFLSTDIAAAGASITWTLSTVAQPGSV